MRTIIGWFFILISVFWVPFWAAKNAGTERFRLKPDGRYYPEGIDEIEGNNLA